jgi:uncharacterized protein (TIRG00374 family)
VSLSKTTLASLILTALVIVVVGLSLEWTHALQTLHQVDLGWIGWALVIFAINYWLRTIRFRLLLNRTSEGTRDLLAVTMLHGLFNYLLPAKSGELSYLVLAKRHLDISLPESAATLITARFFDFGVIALLLPFAVHQFYHEIPRWLILSSAVYCVGVLAAAALLVAYLRTAKSRPPRLERDLVTRIRNGFDRTVDSLRIIDQRRQYLRLWLVTSAIWLCVLLNYYFITASLGFDPTFSQMVVISLILIPLTLIPVQGIANVGTHEAAWIAAFTMFGYSFESALTVAVTSHVVMFAMFVLLGVVGYMLLGPPRHVA